MVVGTSKAEERIRVRKTVMSNSFNMAPHTNLRGDA